MKLLSIGECMIEMSGTGEAGVFRTGFAGDTLNTAWYLRALLPRDWTVGYLTAVGTDPLSDRMLAFMEEGGLDISHIQRHPSRVPGLYMIDLKDGERSFTYWRDTAAARTLADDADRLAAGMADADVIYFSGITIGILTDAARATLFEALAARRAEGARIVFDPNLRPRLWSSPEAMCAATTEAARLADIALPSHDDEATWFGDADPDATARRYRDLGASEVLVKNGGAEMALAVGHDLRPLPAMDRVTPVDTTGAGDSFNGGYLAARLTGAPAEDAARRGHAVAMKVVGHRGALIPPGELAGL
ncbi:sugar kinase [Falsirhodobacter sp. 20TX0035]|uniref:sugar kinase n=1 Tax=Falsirhodobacter sp. 20TX0035 TaxID=3022019 RepID=UPI002330FE76|nr:sugar kinase [Falsirhodobacter sp. 20TX0035]MDB6454569.1 sugar kinase [Falsirhodobacter sp. 20TX0035]